MEVFKKLDWKYWVFLVVEIVLAAGTGYFIFRSNLVTWEQWVLAIAIWIFLMIIGFIIAELQYVKSLIKINETYYDSMDDINHIHINKVMEIYDKKIDDLKIEIEHLKSREYH